MRIYIVNARSQASWITLFQMSFQINMLIQIRCYEVVKIVGTAGQVAKSRFRIGLRGDIDNYFERQDALRFEHF